MSSPRRKKAKVSAKKSQEHANKVTVQKTIDFGDSWPVTSEEDLFGSAAEHVVLPPGPIFQNCSGADIQLARAATAKPNLAKNKGRFLVMLPGLLSFKNQTAAKSKAPPAESAKESTPNGDQSVLETTAAATPAVKKALNDENGSKTPTTTPAAKAKPPPTVLGRIQGLGTDTPTLVIPHGSHTIQFQGKMVESTSRFMNLHLHNRKGAVTCKDIFSSVVVFGDAVVTTSKEQGAAVEEVAAAADNESPTKFKHYGGSARTVNGGGSGGKPITVRRVAKTVRKMAATRRDDSDDEEEPIILDDSEDSEAYVEKISTAVVEKKSRPRRSTASLKKVTYDYNDSESEQEEEESEEEEQDQPKKKRASTTKKAPVHSDSDEFEPDDNLVVVSAVPSKRPRRSTTGNGKKVIELSESDDDEESSSESEEEKPARKDAPKRKAPPKAAATRKKMPAKNKRVTKSRPVPQDTVSVDIESSDDGKAEYKPPAKKARKSGFAMVASSSDDYSDTFEPDDEHVPGKVKKRPRRRSAGEAKKAFDLASSDEDGASEPTSDSSEDVTPVKKKRTSKPAKKSVPKKTAAAKKKAPNDKDAAKNQAPKTGSQDTPIDIFDFDDTEKVDSTPVKAVGILPGSLTPRTKAGRKKARQMMLAAKKSPDGGDDPVDLSLTENT